MDMSAARISPPGRINGEGGIRTLEAGDSPPNALAGRRLQPLGHFSVPRDGTAEPRGLLPRARLPCPSASEGWQSGRMRRSRKPLPAVPSVEGSNPSPSASHHGEVSERSKERDWKSRKRRKALRGFKSLPLR